MVKIGFTGTRKGMSGAQKGALIQLLSKHILENKGDVEFHHGDCVGADVQAAEIADTLNCTVVGHPPYDGKLRAYYGSDKERTPKPYLQRNRNIVNETSFLIAAPLGKEVLRSGTWSTVRYARRQGKQVVTLTRLWMEKNKSQK